MLGVCTPDDYFAPTCTFRDVRALAAGVAALVRALAAAKAVGVAALVRALAAAKAVGVVI